MNVLLAPNGKPSNLTPEQYKLVRSESFKAWFGDWEKGIFTDYQKFVEYKHKIGTGAMNILYIGSICENIDLDKAEKIKEFHKKAFEFLYSEYETANKNGYIIDFQKFITQFLMMYKPVFDLVNQLTSNPNIESTKETLKDFQEKDFQEWINYKNKNISKVVDKNGEPLVVYHGTTESFSVFNNLYSVGHYFSSKIEVAKTYSDNTISCFLDIKNPIYWDVNCRDWEDVRDGVENLASSLLWVVNKKESQIVYIKGEEQINMQLNCDGIIIKNIIDVDLMFDKNNKKWCADTIIVSSSNQIKLADGTNTTFDSSNNDIRFDGGGEVSKNVDSKLKELGFVFNNFNYRYGKKINEQDYITAFYDKTKGLYKIRGTHKYKTPLGENSVGIQFDFENEKDFFEKINDMSNEFNKGGLIASNGKPSNLTPEQYKLVRTNEFKAWFGDWENDSANASKVVDENGEPLVVYHGTNAEFSIFDKNYIGFSNDSGFYGKGFYFTHNSISVKQYGNIIKPYFLKIKNPVITYDSPKEFSTSIWIPKGAKNLLGQGLEPYEWHKWNFYLDDNFSEKVTNYILENGRNGIIAENVGEYIVYDPNQIKLADGTNTTFDSNNPDIRFEKGGDVDYVGNNYLKKKYNHLKKENATFEDLPEIYVRVGKPKMRSGKYFPSTNYVSNEKELGISVFTARYSPNSGFVFIDLNDAKGYEEESGYDIDSTYENFESKNVEIYLVEGEVIKGKPSYMQLYSGEIKDITEPYSRGGDGDRLLSVENFKIIGKLNPNKIVANIEYYKEYKYQDTPNTFGGKNLKKYPKYADGGSVLLAPNGKPSNLTPEQYKLVRTPAFKNWFGDWEKAYETKNYVGVSKVVDEETSEPMLVYHGTNNKFNEFTYESARNSASGLEPIFGFYFSVQKQTKNSSYGKYISPFFLNIKNNLYIDYTGMAESLPKDKLIKLIGKRKVISDFYLKDGKEWIITKVTQQYYRNGENKTMSSHKQLHWIWEAYYSNDKTIEEFQKEVTKILGLDGYYMETLGNENFIAFHPNQIKLADGSNTTFDSNNPDIRFDEGGNLEKNKNMENNFAKGGKILVKETEQGFIHQEQQKYARIGVTDKYQIEAYISMGIQGVNFDSDSLEEKLKNEVQNLYSTYTDYIISEDSKGIDAFFLAEIRQAEISQEPTSVIEQIKENQLNPQKRLEKVTELAESQKYTLESWIYYFKDGLYPNEFIYLMFSSILKFNYNLNKIQLFSRTKITTTNITSFSASALAKLYTNKSNYLLKDYIEILAEEGQNLINEVVTIQTDGGTWFTFLGKGNANDLEITENAEKLTAFVQNTKWCTTSYAYNQLAGTGGYQGKGGNFYVFAEKTENAYKPEIAIRMDGELVGEISGTLDGQNISPKYSEIAKRFCRLNLGNNSAEEYIDKLNYNIKIGDSIQRLENEGMYPTIIEDYLYVVKNKDGIGKGKYSENPTNTKFFKTVNTAISNLPNQFFQAEEFADNLSNLTPNTRYFLGDIFLSDSNDFNLINSNLYEILGNLTINNDSTSFGQLKKIGGDLIIGSRTIQSFDSIEYIGGELKFQGTNLGLTSFGNLTNYGGNIDCVTIFTNVISLGNIQECGDLIIGENSALESTGNLTKAKNIICNSSKEVSFPNLVEIENEAMFNKCQSTELPNLQRVGTNFSINSSRIKSFPNLTYVGGNADFGNNFTKTTQNIERILGNVNLLNSRLMEFTNLKKIGKSIIIKGSFIESLGSLEYLGGNLDLAENNKLNDLGNLNYIGGYFNAKSSNLLSLNNLKQIIQFASFIDSKLEDLGALESIGGSVFFNKSNVNNIGKLNFIGGTLTFGERKDLEAEWLKRQATNQTFNDGGTITENGMYATISISLLTRLLELSNEDLKNDIQIHKVIENISNLSEKALTIDDYNSIVKNVNKFDNGGEIVVYSYYGNIPIKLENHWLDEDTDVELVPVKELIKFREFNRNSMPKYNKQDSLDTIDKLAKSFQEEGIKEPLIIEYSADDKSVLLIEGNHRLNSAEMLGIEYLPARIILRKRPFLPTMKSRSMLVEGVTADDYGYIPSNMKPSKVGIGNTKKVFKEGGIIEGQLHSECNDETGCGRKFQVGEGGHIIEAEREEAVIVPEVFNSTENMTITGTPSEVASALNVMGGGKNFDDGATINSKKYQGTTDKIKPQAQNTDVDDIIEPSSIIVNRRSMGDNNKYEVTGTPRQIASEINSMNGNGVVIEEGGKITKLT